MLVAPWRTMASDVAFLSSWSELASNCAFPNPFFAPWALRPALEAFAGTSPYPPQLATLGGSDRLLGLLPIMRANSYYGRPIPHWTIWTHTNAFHGSPLIEAGREDDFWRALLGWCDANAGPALFLHLPQLDADGPIFEALRRVTKAENRPAAIVQHEMRAMLQSDKSPDAYLAASLSGKKRKELRRQYRRLAEEGTLRFERQREGADLERWIEAFLKLEANGWKGREGSALASDCRTGRMFADMLHGAAEAGVLERLALILDGRPIAMLVNFLTPPGAYSFKTAYDERYARFSPGVLLQRENLDLLDDPQIDWCDSCAAPDHPMIDRLWNERRAMVRVSVALGGQARRALARGVFAFESSARNLGSQP